MKLGVHRPTEGSYSLRPSPATNLRLYAMRAFKLPPPSSTDRVPDPYMEVTVLEGPAPQPTVRTQALSNADFPVWDDELYIVLKPGTVRPPLLRVSVWDTAFGEGGREHDTLLGVAEVRLNDVPKGKVLDIEVAGEQGRPDFTASFCFELTRALPREISMTNITVRRRGAAAFEAARVGNRARPAPPCP